jgi:type VI secretion system protein ImpI
MNECSIAHPFVSDFHAVIELVDGRLCLRDLNSRNGSYGSGMSRLAAREAVPLSSLGPTFILGRAVEVTPEAFEEKRDVGQRLSRTNGSILGNRAALEGAWPSALPPLGASAIGGPAPPARGGAFGLDALPPLSGPGGVPLAPFGGGSGALPQFPGSPPPGPTPWGGDGAMSALGSSLPPLPPLRGGTPDAGPMQSYGAPQGLPVQRGGAVRETRHLSMSTELLALLGLRELASSLVPSVPLETTGDVARLLTKLHDLVEVFCRCFVSLREAHAQFVSSVLSSRAESRHLNLSPTGRRVEAARDPASLAAMLLDWRNQDYDGPQAIEAMMTDIAMHHAALIEGVARGVESLLEELSPEALEHSVRGDASAVFGRHRALWAAYKSRYESMARNGRGFEILFGPEFAASYQEYMQRQPKAPG